MIVGQASVSALGLAKGLAGPPRDGPRRRKYFPQWFLSAVYLLPWKGTLPGSTTLAASSPIFLCTTSISTVSLSPTLRRYLLGFFFLMAVKCTKTSYFVSLLLTIGRGSALNCCVVATWYLRTPLTARFFLAAVWRVKMALPMVSMEQAISMLASQCASRSRPMMRALSASQNSCCSRWPPTDSARQVCPSSLQCR